MSVVVNCPRCQAKLRGPDGLAGKAVRCKGCQEKFRVPGGAAGTDSVADTQQLSVAGSSLTMPAVAAPAAADKPPFDPKPAPPAGAAVSPLPVDDLILEELPRPAIPLPRVETLDAADLIEEPKAGPPADAFSFEEPAPEPVKKKRKRGDDDEDEDDDRPRRRRKREEDEVEPPAKRGYQRKAGTPWGLVIGVGVALLAIGGGVTALVMSGKKEDVKAKTEPPPEAKAKGKGKGKEAGETKAGTEPPDGGGEAKSPDPAAPPDGPKPPVPPKPKKEPPKKEPPKPADVTLPDPPAGELTVVGRVKHRAALDVPADKVRAVRASGVSVVVAFNSQPGFQGAGVKDTLRQYSVATGAKGRQFEIDSGGLGWPRAFAVGTADGLTAVEAGGAGKVSVFDFDTGTLLFDRQDVFEGVPDRVRPIAALALGADRKLFVVDQAGAVDVWDTATRTRVVTGTPPRRPPAAAGKPAAKACAISGGTAVAVALDGKVWAVTAAGATDGKAVTLPDPTAVPLAVGTGAGPDRAAVAYALPGGRIGVAAVHPAGGEVEYQTVLPQGVAAPVEVAWPDDTLVTVAAGGGDAGFIVDIEQRAVTAYLKAVSGKATLYPTGGEFWWLAADAADPKKAGLQSVELPFDGYFDVSKVAQAARRPAFLVPRADGLAR